MSDPAFSVEIDPDGAARRTIPYRPEIDGCC